MWSMLFYCLYGPRASNNMRTFCLPSSRQIRGNIHTCRQRGDDGTAAHQCNGNCFVRLGDDIECIDHVVAGKSECSAHVLG